MIAAEANFAQRLSALVERERRTRFAGGSLGYFWAYLTPLAWIAFVVGLFWVLNRSPAIFVPVEIFVATGFLPYLVFRQTVTSLSRTIPANRYLLYLRPVSINDLLLATSVLEFLNMMVTALLIFGLITLIFGVALPGNPAAVLYGLALAWALGAGLGRFIAIVGMLSDSFARAVPILLRPLFWLSGIFYTAAELPGAVQHILWWSPILHSTEIVRAGYFPEYTSPVAAPWYPILIACLFYLASVPLERVIVLRRLSRHRL